MGGQATGRMRSIPGPRPPPARGTGTLVATPVPALAPTLWRCHQPSVTVTASWQRREGGAGTVSPRHRVHPGDAAFLEGFSLAHCPLPVPKCHQMGLTAIPRRGGKAPGGSEGRGQPGPVSRGGGDIEPWGGTRSTPASPPGANGSRALIRELVNEPLMGAGKIEFPAICV